MLSRGLIEVDVDLEVDSDSLDSNSSRSRSRSRSRCEVDVDGAIGESTSPQHEPAADPSSAILRQDRETPKPPDPSGPLGEADPLSPPARTRSRSRSATHPVRAPSDTAQPEARRRAPHTRRDREQTPTPPRRDPRLDHLRREIGSRPDHLPHVGERPRVAEPHRDPEVDDRSPGDSARPKRFCHQHVLRQDR
jgi:hypothetical protein